METLRVISADSHVIEPLNFWTERIDKKFRDDAPRVVRLESGRLALVAPGIPIASVTQGFARGKGGDARVRSEKRSTLRGGAAAAAQRAPILGVQRRRSAVVLLGVPHRHPLMEPIHVDVDHGRDVERQELRKE